LNLLPEPLSLPYPPVSVVKQEERARRASPESKPEMNPLSFGLVAVGFFGGLCVGYIGEERRGEEGGGGGKPNKREKLLTYKRLPSFLPSLAWGPLPPRVCVWCRARH